MKFSLPILSIVIFLNAGFLFAHQAHFEENSNGISKTEVIKESNKSINNESICIPDVLYNVNMCCCSDALCIGSGNECYCISGNNTQELSCETHCEGLSNDINLTNQNTKTQSIHNLFSRINILFVKIDSRKTESSPKAKFQNTPTYISIHSFLI